MKIIVNDKTYPQGSGKHAASLLKTLEKAKKKPVVCLQPADIHLAQKTSLEVWAQHVDAITFGSHTGWILPENVKQNGAKGTLINHSEHPVKDIGAIVKRCKEIGLKTMVLVPTPKMVKKVVKYQPTYIGFEPPKLIGSETDSVASLPKLIAQAVKNAGDIPLFIGAGVKSKEDMDVGKQLGAKGVLVASAIVKKKDPLSSPILQ